MPTPKYIFTSVDGQLRVELDNSSLQWANDDTSSYAEASVSFYDLKKIYLSNFGKIQREFIFENIGTIGGVTPTDIEEAYDLLSALIPVSLGDGITDAPEDGKTYGRRDGNWEEVDSYKVYSATANQIDTDNPTLNILRNSIGSIVWTRITTGMYWGTLVGAFPEFKTHLSITPSSPTGSYSIFRNSDDIIVVKTQDNGTMPFTDSDNKLFNNSIRIEVYP